VSASERRIAELEEEIRGLKHLLGQQMRSDDALWMESGVSSRTGEPFVHMRWGDQSGQLGASEAREHAMNMLEAASAAEFDAALIKGLTAPEPDGPGFELDMAMRLLVIVREARTGGRNASASIRGE
jgi:hypothetical protein